MVALFKERFVFESLVSRLCLLLLFLSWSYPDVRLFAAYGFGPAGECWLFLEKAQMEGLMSCLATSLEPSDYTKTGRLHKWESQFAYSS